MLRLSASIPDRRPASFAGAPKVTIWRKDDKAYFDYTGTDPQSEGPINYYLNVHFLKMFIGVYLIMTYDPQILWGGSGGEPAMRGKKWIMRKDGTIEPIPSECDHVKVSPGDELY